MAMQRRSLQEAELGVEAEITLDSGEESSTANQMLLEDGAANPWFLDDDRELSTVDLLLLSMNAGESSTWSQMFHQLKHTKFTQQELPAWKPLINPKWAMTIFMAVGIFFIPIGIITLVASNNVIEIIHRYDMECIPAAKTLADPVRYIQNPALDHRCNVTLTVPRKMKHPVFVFYELDRFHQNHRRYMKSRSTKQYQGEDISSVHSCNPVARFHSTKLIVPCGLIAWTLFNDTYDFSLVKSPNVPPLRIPVVRTGIAWKSDVEVKFSKMVYPENFPNNDHTGRTGFPEGGASLDPALPLSKDEDLMVWMRPAPMPRFRKPYGRIERSFHAGQIIRVDIANVYNTYSFKGSKKLVLSTTSFLGGKNPFLGRAYLSMGVLCMLMALISFLVQLHYPRQLGDHSRLSWNRLPRS